MPPGQRPVEGFPRFGTHLHEPPPAIPSAPVLDVVGAAGGRVVLRADALGALPRRRLAADLHCVAGWTAVDLEWGGVGLLDVFEALVAPVLDGADAATHLVFEGLDGYRNVVAVDDALGEDVIIADTLAGEPLGADHGAPWRLVIPAVYAFASVKHLCRIELHETEPDENYGPASVLGRLFMRRPLFSRHPRSRVRFEERNASLPNWAIRPIYRAITPPIAFLSARPFGKRR